MSAGPFVTARYEVIPASTSPVAPAIATNCRVQPETLALVINGVTNSSSTAAVTPGVPRAVVSASARRRGIVRCRGVRIRFTGAVPSGYRPGTIIFLPWMQFASWSTLPPNATGTYLAQPVEVVGVRSGTVS